MNQSQTGWQNIGMNSCHCTASIMAAELDEPGADRGVVDLAQVAGQQLIGQPEPGRDNVQLRAQPFGDRAVVDGWLNLMSLPPRA